MFLAVGCSAHWGVTWDGLIPKNWSVSTSRRCGWDISRYLFWCKGTPALVPREELSELQATEGVRFEIGSGLPVDFAGGSTCERELAGLESQRDFQIAAPLNSLGVDQLVARTG